MAFRLGIYGLDYRVLELFLYIVAVEYFDQCLGRPYKALRKGMEAYRNKIRFCTISYTINMKGLKTYPALGHSPNPYSFWNMSVPYPIPYLGPLLAYYKLSL